MSYCAHCGAEVGRDAASCGGCGKPPRSHPVTVSRRSTNRALVPLLIVGGGIAAVAVLGIVAAVLIPNFLDALQKAKQKRTVADMSEVGAAWMSWLSDEVSASAAGAATTYDFLALEQALPAGELERTLSGATGGASYLERVPELDGWENVYEYRQGHDLTTVPVLGIRSPGRDGSFAGSAYETGSFPPLEYDQDIVWMDGFFVRAPATR